jgi:hypothetical protein
METSRTFSNVLENFRKKRQNFFDDPIKELIKKEEKKSFIHHHYDLIEHSNERDCRRIS